MIVSEARIAANRANGALSKGPRTAEGKEISRRNALKHGLTGHGAVTSEGDSSEIQRRVEALSADMKPSTAAGEILISQMATLSVRAERAVDHETAAIAYQVRHAAEAFDEDRLDQAEQLFENLADDPRNNLRKLRKSPEGVERLVDAWFDLRNDLAIDEWSTDQLARAANLLGLQAKHGRGSRIGALSRALTGDFAALGPDDGGGLDPKARQAWAKQSLSDQIDAEIAALEAHYVTLDFEAIELDRAEAGSRALFDSSKPATFARRYESEARRGFFKALKEFRQVEAEAAALAEASPTPSHPARPEPRMGSFRENNPPRDPQPTPDRPASPSNGQTPVRTTENRPTTTVSTAKSPG